MNATVKSCLMCVHCDFSTGDCDSEPSVRCDKLAMRHANWRNILYEAYTRAELREALASAETCQHYTPEVAP